MTDRDADRLSTRIGDLLRNALRSDRLRDAAPRRSARRDPLDLIEEMMTAENARMVRLFSSLERSREELEQVLTSELNGEKGGLVPFTAGASKALELAEKAARDMSHDYVADAHLLIGLVVVDDGPASALLAEARIRRGSLYDAVAELEFRAQRSLKELMLSEKTTGFEIVLSARQLSDGGVITTLCLLAAILANKRSVAVKVLGNLEVDVDQLRQRVRQELKT